MKRINWYGEEVSLAVRLKKVIGLALYFAILLPLAAQVNFLYTINNGAVTITGFTGGDEQVVVPNSIAGKHVVAIAAYAFDDKVKNIRIPATVTNIADTAFANCTGLRAITVSGGNRVFNSQAGVLFANNQTILVRYPPDKAGRSYTLPSRIMTINNYAFYNCPRLFTVMVPASVTSLGNDAFASDTALQGIYFRGNAPSSGTSVLAGDTATVYHLITASGWGLTFDGLPTATWSP